jgi:hypothetical protein
MKVETDSLNIGMPTAFQNAYARFGPPEMYMPRPQRQGVFPAGNDFHSQLHESRRNDANAMVIAAVQSKALSSARANSSHAGYYGMPKAVLGQRKYANPSMGADVVWSSRWDGMGPFHFGSGEVLGTFGSGLEGGVLRSAPGQAYGKARLNARVEQFDRIQRAKDAFLANPLAGRLPDAFAGAEPTFAQQVGTLPKIELSNLLNSVLANITSGSPLEVVRGTQESFRALSLIVQLAINNPPEDLVEVLGALEGTAADDGIIPTLAEQAEQLADTMDERNASIFNQVKLLGEYYDKVAQYLKDAMTSSLLAKLGAILARGGFQALKQRMDPRRVNGGTFLGLNGIAIKSHGGSDAIGFASAIDLAYEMAASGLVTRLAADLAAIAPGIRLADPAVRDVKPVVDVTPVIDVAAVVDVKTAASG